MRRYDMHIHTRLDGRTADANALLRELEAAGIWGGALFSQNVGPRPLDNLPPTLDRAKEVVEYTKGYEGRLYPFLFLHPYEPDAVEVAKEAVRLGIRGFKMICTDYLVSEARCMKVLETIAQLEKPVVFHTGILWDGRVSSEYSRPLHFEALLDIPRLRFALAHCSWPWLDECIALYGKVLNSYVRDPEVSSEMFIDLTPGTPEIYRRDLFFKLFNIGYDVPHNLLFGTDCSAPGYNSAWSAKWQKLDGEIMDELGVPGSLRQLLYEENFLRFVGEKQKDFTHISPVPDGLLRWSLKDYQEDGA